MENACMTRPILASPVVYDPAARTSATFHADIEGSAVDLISAYAGHASHQRVGHSLNTLSFLLTGLDHHLGAVDRQVALVLLHSQKPADYVHVPDPKQKFFGVFGRSTYPVYVAVNSYLYFARTLLDQVMDLVSCTIRISVGSMNGAANNKGFRSQLRKLGAEGLADLIDRAWAAWGSRLKEYRDMVCHRDALSSPTIELLEDEVTGHITGARLYLPASPESHGPTRGGEFVNVSQYFHDVREKLGKFLDDALLLMIEKKRL